MATSSIHATGEPAKPCTQIHEISLHVQTLMRRIGLLGETVDNLGDRLTPEPDRYKLQALSMIDDAMSMIAEIAAQAREQAEKIEVLSGSLSAQEDQRHG